MQNIDVLIASGSAFIKPSNGWGDVIPLPNAPLKRAEVLNQWANSGQAEYGILWSEGVPLPNLKLVNELVEEGIDIAHTGLRTHQGSQWPDLCLVLQDWTMINGSPELPSNSWRISPELCLMRRDAVKQIGGWDGAFTSFRGAALEFGFRALKFGALVEHRPELPFCSPNSFVKLPTQDFYLFLLRHYGLRWTRYVWLRRSLRPFKGWLEWRALYNATRQHREVVSPLTQAQPVWYEPREQLVENLAHTPVTVIIPTLGRYPYLPQALDSLRQQTVRPREVIVVDQNPPEQRQPETYVGYEDLNLQIIWQDEQGQSLARNTGLAAANSPYVFLFDDDSIADPELIASHLQAVLSGRCQVSTGVAYPPTPTEYELPVAYRYSRLAQTFDTGNSLLPLQLARQMGGLDRNYDFGPGTDNDFGTRLYLVGYRIMHNPKAKRIHFKAPMGGLRTHGARRYNTDSGLWQPFPPITLSYYGLCYLNRQQRFEHAWLSFFTSKFPRELRQRRGQLIPKLCAALYFGFTFLLLPIKRFRSQKQARQLLQRGVTLAEFQLDSS